MCGAAPPAGCGVFHQVLCSEPIQGQALGTTRPWGCHSFPGLTLHCPAQPGTSSAMARPLSFYTVNSSIFLLCINFLSCSCHICTLTSCFPIFNCPQRTSSRATPAFLRPFICHCPNWRREHLKFSLYDCVVFLQQTSD